MAAGRGRICMGIFLLALSLTACSRGQGEASREKFWIPEYVAAISQVDLPDRVARDVYRKRIILGWLSLASQSLYNY